MKEQQSRSSSVSKESRNYHENDPHQNNSDVDVTMPEYVLYREFEENAIFFKTKIAIILYVMNYIHNNYFVLTQQITLSLEFEQRIAMISSKF